MYKRIWVLLSIPLMALFCQCNNANANKNSSGGNASTTKENKITTAMTGTTTKTVTTTTAPMAAANMPAPAGNEMSVTSGNENDLLYTSKEEEKKHATKLKSTKPAKTSKVTYTKGNFPEGSERKLTEWDVNYLSKWGYALMVNEIYARHGMIFADPKLVKYFKRVKWYRPKTRNVDKMLTSVEKENLAFLRSADIASKPR